MESLIIALSMYSRLPVKDIEWNDRNMKMAFAWFPLIGVIIGIFETIVYELCGWLNVNGNFRGALLVFIPLAVTGGIHLDGWIDTRDARSSWGDAKRKLEIMADPHVGAFAVIWCGVYLLISYGAWCSLGISGVAVMDCVFVLERALSGIAAVSFQNARPGGMLDLTARPADRMRVTMLLGLWTIASAIALIVLGGVRGLLALIAVLLVFAHYYRTAMREFGGITGDLAGWFLQNCELVVLVVLALLAGTSI